METGVLGSRGKLIALAVGVAVIVVLAILTLAAGGDEADSDRYVALGDSFSAGMGNEPVTTETVPRACLQSTKSYPYFVQEEVGFASFESTTCSGAVLPDLSSRQQLANGQSAPPQLDTLDGSESFVTLSLSGNDVGFWGIVLKCFSNDNPRATPCRDHYLADGKDALRAQVDATRPALDAALVEIKSRAPKARLFLVGYAQIVPADGKNCLVPMRVSARDARYFEGFQRYLNTMMREAAVSQGVQFVDIYAPSIGHDACKPPDARWIEPRVGSRLTPDVQVHPNEAGERAAARLVLDALRKAEELDATGDQAE